MAKIDILRFIQLANLSDKEKAALRKVLEDRLARLQFATMAVNEALADLKGKGRKTAKKAAKRKTAKRRR